MATEYGPAGYARRLLALWLLLGATAGCDALSAQDTPLRVASLNWSLTETLLALDVTPVAAAELPGYREWVGFPALPAHTVDVGRRMEPNLTVLAGARPDLILSSAHYRRGGQRLRGIAPVLELDIYCPHAEAVEEALEVAAELAERLDRPAAMARLRSRLQRSVGALAERVAQLPPGQSVYVVQFRDAGHVRVFGGRGLFQGVLDRAGLANAWAGEANFWGFAVAELVQLDRPAQHLVVIEPVPAAAETMMRCSPVWQALPVVRHGRVHRLPPVWAYGGVASAARFSELLEAALGGAD